MCACSCITCATKYGCDPAHTDNCLDGTCHCALGYGGATCANKDYGICNGSGWGGQHCSIGDNSCKPPYTTPMLQKHGDVYCTCCTPDLKDCGCNQISLGWNDQSCGPPCGNCNSVNGPNCS